MKEYTCQCNRIESFKAVFCHPPFWIESSLGCKAYLSQYFFMFHVKTFIRISVLKGQTRDYLIILISVLMTGIREAQPHHLIIIACSRVISSFALILSQLGNTLSHDLYKFIPSLFQWTLFTFNTIPHTMQTTSI